MSIIGSFTRRSMRLHRKWTVVTIVGVVIATAMISAVSSFSSSMLDLEKRETIADNGNWHAVIQDMPAKGISVLQKSSDLSSVSLFRDLGYAVLNGSANPDKPYLYVRQFDAAGMQTYNVKLVSGRLPRNGREIALAQHIETNGGVKITVGEKLTVTLGKRVEQGADTALNQNTPYQGKPTQTEGGANSGESFAADAAQTYTVVGIIARPSFEPAWAPGYTAIVGMDDTALTPTEKVNAAVLVRHPTHSVYDTVDALAKQAGADIKNVSFNNTLLHLSGVFGTDNLQITLYGTMGVILLIILIAAASLIYNAFAISVSERTSQLGMLASVGATRAQKRRTVYLESFYIGLIGIPLGVLGGIAGIGVTLAAIQPLLASFLNLHSGDSLRLVVSPSAIILAVVVAALTLFISAWIPARRASRITPIDAIRQTKEIRLNARTVKTGGLTRRVFGFEAELALKNLKRSRRKYRATVVSLVISLVLFLTASYYPAFVSVASRNTQDTQNYDEVLSFSHSDSDTRAAFDTLSQLDVVTKWARTQGFGVYSLTVPASMAAPLMKKYVRPQADGSYSVSAPIFSYDGQTLEALCREAGVDEKTLEDPNHPAVLVFNEAKAVQNSVFTAGAPLNVKVGDTLRFGGTGKGGNTGTGTAAVAGIIRTAPMGMNRLPFDKVQLVTSETGYSALSGLLAGGKETDSGVYLYLNTTDSTQVQQAANSLKVHPYVYDVKAEAQSQQNLNMVLEIFLFGFIILITLICVANMFNTITTNVALRRREFAMLRAVGMTPKGFGKMLRFESLFYGLKALLWGLPISFLIGGLLNRLVNSSVAVGFVFPWRYYLIAVLVLFLIVLSTMLYASAKLRRENIVDALTGEDL